MVERYADAVRAAGLKVEGIDLSAFALVRALADQRPTTTPACSTSTSPASPTSPSPAAGTACSPAPPPAAWTRWCTRWPTAASLTLEHAAPVADPRRPRGAARRGRGRPPRSSPPRASMLEEGVHQLADTVRNSLNFYRMQQNAETVERAVLTGPAVAIPGFAERLATALGMPVEARMVAQTGEDEHDAEPPRRRRRPRRRGRLAPAAPLRRDHRPCAEAPSVSTRDRRRHRRPLRADHRLVPERRHLAAAARREPGDAGVAVPRVRRRRSSPATTSRCCRGCCCAGAAATAARRISRALPAGGGADGGAVRARA